MNPINLFGQTIQSDITSKEYIDSKFISLIRMMKTKVDLNFAQQNFVQKAGDKMTGNLDMSGNRLTNTGSPVDEYDCATRDYLNQTINSLSRTIRTKADLNFVQQNFITKDYFNSINKDSKLYVQITSVQDETDVEKLCKIGAIIAKILTKYRAVVASVLKEQFLNSFAYAISMYSKYKNIVPKERSEGTIEQANESSESSISLNGQAVGGIQDVSACTIFVDFKINIIKIIEALAKDIFQELKKGLNNEKLFSSSKRGIRKRYRKFLVKRVEELDPEGTNEELQLLLYKNLLFIDMGFIYLMDSLLRNLLA
jgi:hypothetical protein